MSSELDREPSDEFEEKIAAEEKTMFEAAHRGLTDVVDQIAAIMGWEPESST